MALFTVLVVYKYSDEVYEANLQIDAEDMEEAEAMALERVQRENLCDEVISVKPEEIPLGI